MKLIVKQYDTDLTLKANKTGMYEIEKIVYDNRLIVDSVNKDS